MVVARVRVQLTTFGVLTGKYKLVWGVDGKYHLRWAGCWQVKSTLSGVWMGGLGWVLTGKYKLVGGGAAVASKCILLLIIWCFECILTFFVASVKKPFCVGTRQTERRKFLKIQHMLKLILLINQSLSCLSVFMCVHVLVCWDGYFSLDSACCWGCFHMFLRVFTLDWIHTCCWDVWFGLASTFCPRPSSACCSLD